MEPKPARGALFSLFFVRFFFSLLAPALGSGLSLGLRGDRPLSSSSENQCRLFFFFFFFFFFRFFFRFFAIAARAPRVGLEAADGAGKGLRLRLRGGGGARGGNQGGEAAADPQERKRRFWFFCFCFFSSFFFFCRRRRSARGSFLVRARPRLWSDTVDLSAL